MKKLFAFTLTVILAAALVLPVSAEDSDYDEAELKQLLTDAFEIYVEFDRNFDDYEEGSTVQLYSPEELLKGTEAYTYFARRIGEYRMFADFESALDACVTSDVKDDFIKYEHILNIDGYTYSCILAGMHQNQGIWFEPTDMGAENFEHFDLDSTFKVVSATEDKITAEFLLYFFDHENPIREYTVEYTKTDAGWRVSGGTFVSDMLNPPYRVIYPDQAPQTSLTAVTYAAVAALALGVVVVKKKRG